MKFFKKKSNLLIFLLINCNFYYLINPTAPLQLEYKAPLQLGNNELTIKRIYKDNEKRTQEIAKKEAKEAAEKAEKELIEYKQEIERAKNEGMSIKKEAKAAKWYNRAGKFLNESKFLNENKAAPAIVGSAIGIGFGLLLEKIIRFNNEFQQLPDEEKNEYIKKNKRKIEDDKDYIENNLNNNLINNLNNIYLKIKNNKDFKLDKNDKETIEIGKNIIERFGFIGALKDNNNGINNWYEKLFKKIIKTDGSDKELKNELQYNIDLKYIDNDYYNIKEIKYNIEELKDTYLFKIINEINKKIGGISNSDFWKNNKNKIYKAGIGAGVMTGLGIAGYIWHKNNKSKKLKLREKRRNAIKNMNYKFNK